MTQDEFEILKLTKILELAIRALNLIGGQDLQRSAFVTDVVAQIEKAKETKLDLAHKSNSEDKAND